jgi:G patch domain/KOW motif-containing protein
MSEHPPASDAGGGKRLGFQMKGTSKRQRIVETEKVAAPDLITTIEGSTINSVNPTSNENVLVIPLIQPAAIVSTAQPKEKVKDVDARLSAAPALTLDQVAAAELLADLEKGDSNEHDALNNLVIKQAQPAEASNDSAGTKKKAPLLMLNVAPELLNITNENDRFKYDVSSRAEDLNVRSDIYEAIPVGQFGAALLRGMGWKGPDKEDGKKKEEKMVAREQRLGLGAQARPPDKPKHHSKKDGIIAGGSSSSSGGGGRSEADIKRERDRQRWEQRAEERLRDQKLYDADYVWLRAPAELSGKRAVVVAARGVPGLDRVRLQLEHTGRIVEVPRKDCVLLSPAEMEDKPFAEAENSAELREALVKQQADGQFKGLKKEGGESNSSGGGDKDNREKNPADLRVKLEGDGREKSKEDRAVKSERSAGSSSSQHQQAPPPAQAQQQQTVFWLREGIRVKIVSKSVGGARAYLQKGTVLDVYARGRASVRLDDNSVLDEVNERHVETIVPAVGGACLVLLGEHRGQHAVLMEKHREDQRVVVQLSEELEMVELDMDSIAATSR